MKDKIADRQAALREALEREIAELMSELARHPEVRWAQWKLRDLKIGISLRKYILKRLGHCNTCRGRGWVYLDTGRADSAEGIYPPCPDCVPDEIELLGKMGK